MKGRFAVVCPDNAAVCPDNVVVCPDNVVVCLDFDAAVARKITAE